MHIAIKRKFLALFVLLLCAGSAVSADGEKITRLSDLNGKRLGVLAGTILDQAANSFLDYTDIVYYDNTEAELAALLSGEIDAMIDDEPVARFLAGQDPRLHRLAENLADDEYGFALRPGSGDDELFDAVEKAVTDSMTDGTLATLMAKWLDSPDNKSRIMPPLPIGNGGGARTLRFGVSAVSAPFTYWGPDRKKIIGLDVELMGRVAQRIGMRLEIVEMEFSELVPSLLAGDVDVIGSCLSITPERKKIIRFTSSYYQGGVAALVLK